jgi:hypothetical protein
MWTNYVQDNIKLLPEEQINSLGLRATEAWRRELKSTKQRSEIRNSATTSFLQSCPFPMDYSHIINGKCNKCNYCPRLGNMNARKTRPASIVWDNEVFWNKSLFMTPITVSRQCDPWRKESIIDSLNFSKYILECGGKIIFLSPNSRVPKEIFELGNKFGNNIQYQIKAFSDDTFSGENVRYKFCSHYPLLATLKKNAKKIQEEGIKVTIKFDPIIIGINDMFISNIISEFEDIGINSFIFKQVFATNYLCEYISRFSRRYSSFLTEKTNIYHTYDNNLFIDYIGPILLKHPDSIITFCTNPTLNKLMNNHKNCCQFDNCEWMANPKWNISDAYVNKKDQNLEKFIKFI